jgi:hypothetical protein
MALTIFAPSTAAEKSRFTSPRIGPLAPCRVVDGPTARLAGIQTRPWMLGALGTEGRDFSRFVSAKLG